MKEQVERLGFAVWADNIIVNAVENMGGRFADHESGTDDCRVVIRIVGGDCMATVRAYVPGHGWQYHDRVIKLRTR